MYEEDENAVDSDAFLADDDDSLETPSDDEETESDGFGFEEEA